ncbi:MAG TPA: hypothetical protein ENJ19_12145 [Gammaproteobacteria bacterium]|nr:hypothetical protein [Gammaproteobacteria bacterium]
MGRERVYVGLDQDEYGGMNPTGTIIRDAWVFGFLPEGETCAGWGLDRIQKLYDQVSEAWAEHGYSVAKLPQDLRQRHLRIHAAAVARAREQGWSPELLDED